MPPPPITSPRSARMHEEAINAMREVASSWKSALIQLANPGGNRSMRKRGRGAEPVVAAGGLEAVACDWSSAPPSFHCAPLISPPRLKGVAARSAALAAAIASTPQGVGKGKPSPNPHTWPSYASKPHPGRAAAAGGTVAGGSGDDSPPDAGELLSSSEDSPPAAPSPFMQQQPPLLDLQRPQPQRPQPQPLPQPSVKHVKHEQGELSSQPPQPPALADAWAVAARAVGRQMPAACGATEPAGCSRMGLQMPFGGSSSSTSQRGSSSSTSHDSSLSSRETSRHASPNTGKSVAPLSVPTPVAPLEGWKTQWNGMPNPNPNQWSGMPLKEPKAPLTPEMEILAVRAAAERSLKAGGGGGQQLTPPPSEVLEALARRASPNASPSEGHPHALTPEMQMRAEIAAVQAAAEREALYGASAREGVREPAGPPRPNPAPVSVTPQGVHELAGPRGPSPAPVSITPRQRSREQQLQMQQLQVQRQQQQQQFNQLPLHHQELLQEQLQLQLRLQQEQQEHEQHQQHLFDLSSICSQEQLQLQLRLQQQQQHQWQQQPPQPQQWPQQPQSPHPPFAVASAMQMPETLAPRQLTQQLQLEKLLLQLPEEKLRELMQVQEETDARRGGFRLAPREGR